MNASAHMSEGVELQARAYTIPGDSTGAPFDCLKLTFSDGEKKDEVTLLNANISHAAEIIRALQEQYPELKPPVYRGGSGFDDPEFSEPPCGGDGERCTAPDREACDGCREGVAVDLVAEEHTHGCAACTPSLHDHDCQCCDGQREVANGE